MGHRPNGLGDHTTLILFSSFFHFYNIWLYHTQREQRGIKPNQISPASSSRLRMYWMAPSSVARQ